MIHSWEALGGGGGGGGGQVDFVGLGALPSAFAVTDFAAAAVATAGLAIAERLGGRKVVVDRRLASMWFQLSLRPVGWKLPPLWDPIAGDYPRVVAGWDKSKLEAAVVAEGGCAAEMRSASDWEQHPQGRAVAGEPLFQLSGRELLKPAGSRPLAGVRVLDLTRVLAGPVATRFLAGYGAEVLRIDPPGWDEPGVVPEVALGKRCARLNLREAEDRAIFSRLLSQADILIHGYRPEALERLGFGAGQRKELKPDLIDVSLDAYGWTGPWAGRRGFDSLVQMSSGIAEAGMRWRKAQKPVPLPVQALDHAAGYLMAAAAIRGQSARVSLARIARLLLEQGPAAPDAELAPETEADLAAAVEATSWGDARRLQPPLTIEGAPMRWDLPARALGWTEARWD